MEAPYASISAICWISLEFLVTAAIGYAGGHQRIGVATGLCLLAIPPFVGICRSLGIEFGSPGHSRAQLICHFFIFGPLALVVGLPFGLSHELTKNYFIQTAIAVLCLLVCGVLTSLFSGRVGYLLAAACAIPRGLYGVVFSRAGNAGLNPWYGWLLISWLLCTSFVRYKKDQCTLAMIGVVAGNNIAVGNALARDPTGSTCYYFAFVMVVVSYAQAIWIRRGRQLPPGLKGCKFVTLEYLQRIAASGEGIKRCQELPPDAFGHPQKARYVVTVSHRWLHQHTCDIATEDCPEGIRLHTMLESLNEYFSLKGLGKGRGFRGRLERMMMALTGSRDVVLFFDFMSLPQETLNPDGTVTSRSLSEQNLFSHCLPNMGALYSMLPVLVCEAVPQGVRAYLESGWCFAEFSTAWLGCQLTPYSSESPGVREYASRLGEVGTLPKLTQFLDEELERKHFLREGDRRAVRSILRGFLAKRGLVKALVKRSKEELTTSLASEAFRDCRLLDQAVDSILNTPLHLAVALNFPEGVGQLLDAGARKDLRNLHGDLPVQCLMFPRLSLAAFTCRKYTILDSFERLSTFSSRSERWVSSCPTGCRDDDDDGDKENEEEDEEEDEGDEQKRQTKDDINNEGRTDNASEIWIDVLEKEHEHEDRKEDEEGDEDQNNEDARHRQSDVGDRSSSNSSNSSSSSSRCLQKDTTAVAKTKLNFQSYFEASPKANSSFSEVTRDVSSHDCGCVGSCSDTPGPSGVFAEVGPEQPQSTASQVNFLVAACPKSTSPRQGCFKGSTPLSSEAERRLEGPLIRSL